jgi:hypothetical protein
VRILCDLGFGRKAALFGETGHGKRPIGNTVRIAQAMVINSAEGRLAWKRFQATSALPLNSREPSKALRIRHPSTRRF